MGSPLAGAGAASLKAGRAWALLHRSPEFLDPQELPKAVQHVVHVEAPPKLSTLVVSRARALLAGGGDVEDLVGHVECADAEGDILLSVWSADEQGRPASPPRLLVCRPESGTVDLVPSVPEQLGRLESLAPLGIVRGAAPPGPRGGGHYLIVQVQRADSSPSSPSSAAAPGAHLIALVFSSASGSWTTKEVRPRCFHALSSEDEATWAMVTEDEVAAQHERPPPWFEPRAVLSHDSAGLLAFLDVENGLLLLFHPLDDGVARCVQFPISEREVTGLEELDVGAVPAADVGHCVAFSQGELCVLKECQEGRIIMWSLKDEEDRWVKEFEVTSSEIYCCDSSIDDCQSSVVLGAVDPTDRCRLVFFMPEAERTLMVAVNPFQSFFRRVGFVQQVVDAGRNSWLDIVIWKFDPAVAVAQCGAGSTTGGNQGWRLSRKGLGGMAHSALRIARKHIHRVQPLAEVAGTAAEAIGVPFASKVAPTVAGLVKANQAACVGEEIMNWLDKPSPRENKVVGTDQEATVVIKDWLRGGKPKGMVVTPAPGLSHDELLALRKLFREKHAEELLLSPPPPDDDEYCMVSPAAGYFPR